MTKIEKYKNKHNSRLILSILSGLLMLSLLLINFYSTNENSEWDIDDLEDYLGIDIPETATEIGFHAEKGRSGGEISLTFLIPSESVSMFTEDICNGNLHKGYNPFNAENMSQPINNSYLIKMSNFTYYSFSPNTTDLLYGNRCQPYSRGIQQILVTEVNSGLFEVKFFQPGDACQTTNLPCSELGVNYINPINNFPLMVVGLISKDGEYNLVHNEICFEMMRSYTFSWLEGWSYLKGAEVIITVDDEVISPGLISESGRLVPVTPIGTNHPNQDFRYWNYCLYRKWDEGLHKVKIELDTVSGEELIHTWEFHVEAP